MNNLELAYALKSTFCVPEFQFKEYGHVYEHRGRKLRSCSEAYGKFKKPFNKALVFGCAKRENVTPEFLQAKWNANAKAGRDNGKETHKGIEFFYKSGCKDRSFVPSNAEVAKRLNSFYSIYDSTLYRWHPVCQELCIFSLVYGIGGTIDALFEEDGELVVVDWKTNANFTNDSDKHYDMLLPPFSQYKENDLNTYSLQLSVYALILAEHDFKVKNMRVVHCGPNGPSIHFCKDFRGALNTVLRVA